MNLNDLKYRVEDDVNFGAIIYIVGFEGESEIVKRHEDEIVKSLRAYFLLKINKGKVVSFKISDKPFKYEFLLASSGNDYGWYSDWGPEIQREIFIYLLTGEGNKVRKNKL